VLTLERGWDRVSVKAVCARAQVGRSTFYAHFADKEEALVGGLEHVRDDLRRRPRKADFGFVRGLLAHAEASRRLFRAVIGKRSGLAVQRRFRDVVVELMAGELEAQGVRQGALPAMSRFLAGAFVELLFGWVDASHGHHVADVEREFVRLARPVVALGR